MNNTLKSKLKNFLAKKVSFHKIYLGIAKLLYSRFYIFRQIAKTLTFPIYFLLQEQYYKLLIFSLKILKNNNAKPKKHRIRLANIFRLLPETFFVRAITGDKHITKDEYMDVLKQASIDPGLQFEWSQYIMDIGRLDLAKAGFVELTQRGINKVPFVIQLQAYRYAGIASFLIGNNNDAVHYFQMAGRYRGILSSTPITSVKYRILGSGWFAAIGHVCMLDYYLKYVRLYLGENVHIVAPVMPGQIPGKAGQLILNKFKSLGIESIHPDNLEDNYNKWANENDFPKWDTFSQAEKMAMVDDFWEYNFNDGEVLCFAHAISRIQKEWECEKYPPLFALTRTENQWIENYLSLNGAPKNTWYVCLHVREPGFHKNWNTVYPSMRDADICDYTLAIEAIVNAGGWVIRMGDPSMKPLKPMRNVIDYAHSCFNAPLADVLLAAGCRFMLGTNSGYVNICSMYNVPCVLTNWVPIGWPLWLSQDLIVPKLFRNKDSGKYLTLEELFKTEIAFIQNWNELPTDIELIANTPEELAQVTLEMLSRCKLVNEPSYRHDSAGLSDEVIQNYYNNIAERYGGFTGARLARTFVDKYSEVFTLEKTAANKIHPLVSVDTVKIEMSG